MPFSTGKKELFWTKHALAKMKFYKLSEQRVRRVLNSPKRIEDGIAPKTIAMMQPFGNKNQHELWVMVQNANRKGQSANRRVKIISAWRYPGRTKAGEPLPPEILQEFKIIS